MNGEVARTPVQARLPWCYTLHRGDDACAACPLESACRRALADNAARLTVRQAADAAIAEYRRARGEDNAEVDDLMKLAARSSGVSEFAVCSWLLDQSWQRAMRVVQASCAAAGWDARTYVRAIAETVGRFSVSKGWKVSHGLFVGEKARERFERWARRNRRANNDLHADHVADSARQALLAGECCFASRILTAPSETIEEAEAFARGSFPAWSLAQTGGRDDLRLPALAGALASVDPGLPHRVLAPSGAWTWDGVRDALLDMTRLEEPSDDEPLDLDPELGDLL